MENITKKVYRACEWVMLLFLLQIYWAIGTLVGGIILGMIPSSIALFSSIRKFYREPQELKLFSYFMKVYKVNFKTGLVIGIWYVAFIILGIIYRQFLGATTDSWLAYTHILLYAILLLGGLLSLYILPVYVHYEFPLPHLLPTAGLIMVSSMKWNLPLLLSLVVVCLIFLRFSVGFLFFGSSLPAFIIFYFSNRAFSDFDVKRADV